MSPHGAARVWPRSTRSESTSGASAMNRDRQDQPRSHESTKLPMFSSCLRAFVAASGCTDPAWTVYQYADRSLRDDSPYRDTPRPDIEQQSDTLNEASAPTDLHSPQAISCCTNGLRCVEHDCCDFDFIRVTHWRRLPRCHEC